MVEGWLNDGEGHPHNSVKQHLVPIESLATLRVEWANLCNSFAPGSIVLTQDKFKFRTEISIEDVCRGTFLKCTFHSHWKQPQKK